MVDARTKAQLPQHSWPWAGSVAEVTGFPPPQGAHVFPPTDRVHVHLVTAVSCCFCVTGATNIVTKAASHLIHSTDKSE